MTYLDTLFGLSGRWALVTGGGTGIGRMTAEALAQAGARVMLVSRKAEVCAAAAEQINSACGEARCEGFAGDVASEEGVSALASAVAERCGALSILVNNAGKAWMSEDLGSFPYRAWDPVFRVNVAGPFALTQQLLPLLRAAATAGSPARVINIGSMVGTRPMGNNAYSYAASKSALHHLTAILGQELAPNVTVNAIAPGPFPTQMTAWTDAEAREGGQGVPMARWGEARDIAGAMLFLCGGGGAFTTGSVIPVDGGVTVAAGPDFGRGVE
jgi:NAD(P)-dependent dehydrogenase (short-subunit alcohol dehydrogenase family)